MSFFKKVGKAFKDVGKVIAEETEKTVNEISKSPVINDIASVTKDVGTSATRIVTDTAIDIANVSTGFQFNDEMEAAKQTMSDAGVLSAADAIKKNHYPFLERMEEEARRKLSQIQTLFQSGQNLERERDQLVSTLSDMCGDVILLSQESLEAETLLAEAQKIPEWEKWATILDLPPMTIAEVDQVSASTKKWEQVGKKIAMSNLIVGVADGTAALIALGSLSKAKRLTKVSKLTRTGSSAVVNTAAKSSKFLKVGKLAGRASGVLAVVSVGLDIGLSVAELERQKAQLEKTLAELDRDIAEAQRDLSALRQEKSEILSRINELLNSVEPPQTLKSWPAWAESTQEALRSVVNRLISVNGIIDRALQKAEQTRGKPLEQRVNHVAAIDPNISKAEALEIIKMVDREAGYSEPQSTEQTNFQPISSRPWSVEGSSQPAIMQNEKLNQIVCMYSLPGNDTSSDATWKYYTTAELTKTLSIQWSYGGSHASENPIGEVVVFADSPSGREVITLYDDVPPLMSNPSEGSASIQVYEQHTFGIIITAKTGLAEVQQDSASINMTLGSLTLQFFG